MHQLVYAAQCPNCMRFIGALDRTPMKDAVAKIDVNSLTPDQCRHVSAVPMLVLDTGGTLVGTQAFEWLKQYERDVDVESFSTGRGLPFSDIESDQAFASFAMPYSQFEPVP